MASLFNTHFDISTGLIGGALKITRTLGSGSYGTVYECRHQQIDNFVMAAKGSSRLTENATMKEAEFLSKLRHPNICDFYGVARTPDRFLMFIEFIEGQTLSSMVHQRAPRIICAGQVITIFAQVTAGVGYLHCKKILHRDLNPNNVMVCEPMKKVKIIDLGLSRPIGTDGNCSAGHFALRRSVLAPELFTVFGRHYGARSDVFSIGVLMCYASTGKLPFSYPQDLNMMTYKETVKSGPVSNGDRLVLDAVKDLIAKMVAFEPRDRPRCTAVLETLDQINHDHGLHAVVPGGWPKDPAEVIRHEGPLDGPLDQQVIRKLASRKGLPRAALTPRLGSPCLERVEYNYYLFNN